MKRAMPFARKSQSGSHVFSGNHNTNAGQPQPPIRPLFLAIAETFLKFPKADFLALAYRGLGEVQVNPPVLETEVVVYVRYVRRTVGHPCLSIAVLHLD